MGPIFACRLRRGRQENYFILLYTNTLCAVLASWAIKKKAKEKPNYLSDKAIKHDPVYLLIAS
jgi:hypothetical protein